MKLKIIPDLDAPCFPDKPSIFVTHMENTFDKNPHEWKILMLTMTNIPPGKMITKPGSFFAHHYIRILVVKEINDWKNMLRAAGLLALFRTYWAGA